jgi:oligopeptide transport system ATP-binding protein
VGAQIVEAIELHQPLRGRSAWARAVDMLDRVGIAETQRRAKDHPHQLSGGMRQRVMIAMALSCEPDLLIADEPTTALDATVQRQVLDLLRTLQVETGMSILLITHDLGVVAEFADEAYVMYAGRIVEHGPAVEVVRDPLHPYTSALLRCTPGLVRPGERLAVIPGGVPDPSTFPTGCRFHPRCALSAERAADPTRPTVSLGDDDGHAILRRCMEVHDGEASGVPPLVERRPGRFAACWET